MLVKMEGQVAQTQAERRTATRNAILGAARDLFGAAGYAKVSAEDVAAAAGVTKGAIYHHFGSKDALFEAVLVAEQTCLAGQAEPDATGGLEERLSGALYKYLSAVSKRPTRQIVLVDGPAVMGWARWREIDEHMFGQSVRQALADLRSWDTDADRLAALTTLVMGAVTEAALTCAAAAEPTEAAARMSAALLLMMKGLAQPLGVVTAKLCVLAI